MFSAAPANASLVEMAMMTGRPLRRWLFAAMVTGPSAMEWASLANVFPVQGAIISASSRRFGPMGSTCASVCSGWMPQIRSVLAICSAAAPNRLSVS